MDFTNPFVGMVGRKMTREELARAIRIDLAAELDAINLYQAHIDATDDEQAKKILASVRDEEKEHVAEFVELLKMLDPVQVQEFEIIPAHIAGILSKPLGHESPAEETQDGVGTVAKGGEVGEADPIAQSASPGLTVGSLLDAETTDALPGRGPGASSAGLTVGSLLDEE